MFDTSATAHDLNVDNGTFVVDGSASNVGIGTTTQSFSKLQVKAATDQHVSIFTNSKGLTIGGITDAGGSAALRIAGAPLRFSGSGGGASAGPHLEIDTSGNSTFSGDIFANTDSTHDIGTSATRFANAYFDTMYGTVGTVAQPNITSLGTLSALTISGDLTVDTNTLKVESSNNRVLVGKSSTGLGNAGVEFEGGQIKGTSANQIIQYLNRTGSNGDILELRKDNTIVSKIGARSGVVSYLVLDPRTSVKGAALIGGSIDANTGIINPGKNDGDITDGALNLGTASSRFKDAHFSGNITGTLATAAQPNITSLGTLTALTVNGVIGGSAGSASAPSLSFSGDPNTGIYNLAADNLGFATGGVSRGFWSATQFNVTGNGVFSGTGSFGGNLSVTGQGDFTTQILVGSNNTTLSENNLISHAPGHFYIDHATVGQHIIFRTSNSSSRDETALTLSTGGNTTVHGHLYVTDGSASAPAITFSNDNDTGIIRVTTNALGLVAAGSRKFYVNGTNAYYQNLTQVQIDSGNFYVNGHTGFRTTPDSNYAFVAMQNSSLTHGGYMSIQGGTATGLDINASATSLTCTNLLAKQSQATSGGYIARFQNSAGDKLAIKTDGDVDFGGSGSVGKIGNDGRWRGGYRTQSQNAFIGQKPFNIYAVGERWHELHNPASNTEYAIAQNGSYTTDQNTIFYHPSAITSQVIRYDFAPRGGVDLVYEAVSNSSSTWNGGFNSSAFTVDPDKCYMFGYYFRRTGSSTAGTHYFGFSHGVPAGTGSTVNSNPYFFANGWGSYARYQWHVAVCYLYPRYYTAAGGDAGGYIRTGGVWNLNGDYRHGYTRFKQPTNQTTQTMRAYNYYCADPNMTYQYSSPFVYECNGAQPTLGELLIGNERIGE